MKYYSRERDMLQAARAHITSTVVSKEKKAALDPKFSVPEWLVKLKKDTEPPKEYMLTKTNARYLKPNKLLQWLEK